jgi:hypothetical protein
MKSHLPTDEADALKRILRHHHVPLTGALIDNLGQFINWIHEMERANVSFLHDQKPIPMISLLGNMGIYGAEYVDKVSVDD